MKYTGTYTQREQAQRTATLRRIVRTAAKIGLVTQVAAMKTRKAQRAAKANA